MWPENLKSIELRGGMNFTKLWMVKERFDAGHLKILKEPEAAWHNSGQYETVYNTLYGDEAGTYCFCTIGIPAESGYCVVTRINKLTDEHASIILSGWPYE